MDKKSRFAVLMAGGRGERFWPQSRISHPKQLLRLIGNLTMIEQTAARIRPLFEPEQILVITNSDYAPAITRLLSDLPPENIIGEPIGRDTGACVALAAALVRSRGGNDAVMCLLPADHVIRDSATLCRQLHECMDEAERTKALITIGIMPTEPATSYGYIHCQDKRPDGFYEVESFREKPDLATARKLLATGEYLWNSGMFVWSVRSIFRAMRQHASPLAELADELLASDIAGQLDAKLAELYPDLEKISVDYAIMEKAEEVLVIESRFDWDDAGSWNSLRNQLAPDANGNVVNGLFRQMNSHNCIVAGDSDHLIAAIDVDDLVIVQTQDATLITRVESTPKIKQLLAVIGSDDHLKKYL